MYLLTYVSTYWWVGSGPVGILTDICENLLGDKTRWQVFIGGRLPQAHVCYSGNRSLNPLPTIRSSLKKQKSL